MDLKGLLNSVYTIVLGHHGGGGEDGKACHCEPQAPENGNNAKDQSQQQRTYGGFQMPLHYPRYKKEDYEEMEEWKLNLLLDQYGLMTAAYHHQGTISLQEKREFAIGAFVWP